MNRAYLTLCLILTMLLIVTVHLTASVPPIPPEVKSHMMKFIEQMSKHAEMLYATSEKAATAEDMARALEVYHQNVRPLIEGVVKLKAKYADFFAAADNSNQETSGDTELDKANEIFEKRMEKLGLVMGKAIQWMDNPKMKAALDKMQETMSLLDNPEEKENEED